MFASTVSLIKGAAAGAGLMYFFDPDRGRRRRAEVVAQTARLLREAEEVWDKGRRDLSNRATGLFAETRRQIVAEPTDDRTLVARVRSCLGHLVENAQAVEVSAREGTVTLRGTVRPGEPERLVPAIENIPGVEMVESGLTTAGEPVPAPVRRDAGLSPAARLLLMGGGGLLVADGLARRGFGHTLLGAVGCGMVARSLLDRPGRFAGVDATLDRLREGVEHAARTAPGYAARFTSSAAEATAPRTDGT